ncbi:DUF1611 domain-containing protein [Phenylobacterium sp.]|uniref:DUF1611 domain-containing protein n=1 Tax=Phenylobacterium sp. TaxID=1871053 RepID=UPI0035B349EB
MLKKPYLLFLGEARDAPHAKTAFGLRDWAGDDVVGQHRLEGCAVDLGVPDLSFAQAVERGARSLVIGVAPVGGAVTASWIPHLTAAIDAGLDLVSGLHQRLADVPELARAAEARGVALHDVRRPARAFPVATGRKRSGRRLLTVGVDCAVGKKYAALAIAAALRERGADATFRATGQTGIMIAGDGVPLDAVVADFAAGAAEWLSPDNSAGHWDVIEGQGSLFHPAYAGVSLALLHGSQPDAFVLCLDPQRRTLASFDDYPIVSAEVAIERHRLEGALTNPAIRCAGLSINTSGLDEAAAEAVKAELRQRFGLPVFDPIRDGAGELADHLLAADAGAAA